MTKILQRLSTPGLGMIYLSVLTPSDHEHDQGHEEIATELAVVEDPQLLRDPDTVVLRQLRRRAK